MEDPRSLMRELGRLSEPSRPRLIVLGLWSWNYIQFDLPENFGAGAYVERGGRFSAPFDDDPTACRSVHGHIQHRQEDSCCSRAYLTAVFSSQALHRGTTCLHLSMMTQQIGSANLCLLF